MVLNLVWKFYLVEQQEVKTTRYVETEQALWMTLTFLVAYNNFYSYLTISYDKVVDFFW